MAIAAVRGMVHPQLKRSRWQRCLVASLPLQAPLCSFQELVNVENNPMPLSEVGIWMDSSGLFDVPGLLHARSC